MILARTAAVAAVVVLSAGCGGSTKQTPAVPAFDKPVNLGPQLNSKDFDGGPSISADGLLLYFVTDRGGVNGGDIWVAARQSATELFGNPMTLGAPVNSSSDEGAPSISADGLELFFDRAPDGRIFAATRSKTSEPFGQPMIVDLGRTDCCDGFPDISGDGRELYFCSNRPGGYGGDDIWLARRTSRSSPFDPPVNLGPTVNGAANDCEPSVSKDGRALFIGSDRNGGDGGFDIWAAVRAERSDPFGKVINLGPSINSIFPDERPNISSDGATLYFMSNRPGGSGFFDVWQATRRLSG